MGKPRNPNLTQININLPKRFLKEFDDEIKVYYPSRAEAIRRGMILVLEEVRSKAGEV